MGIALDGRWRAPVPAGEGLEPHRRLLSGQLSDAIALRASGTAAAADIDTAMRLGAGYAQGPFEVLAELGEATTAFGAVPTSEAIETTGPVEGGPVEDEPWRGPVGVVGTGRMASGIVESIIRTGRSVVAIGRSQSSLERLRATVARSLDKAAAKGRLNQDEASRLIEAIDCSTELGALAGVDVVIEAVAEDLPTKRWLFTQLDACLPAAIPLATNTSSFRVAEISSGVGPRRPALGLHFFNPAPTMKLVEVVPGPDVPPETTRAATAWVRSLGKTPVRCADSRGFIVNRLLIPFLNDAVRLLESGSEAEEIDELMTSRAGHPMGPFALLDLIGLDITVATLTSMSDAVPDTRLAPAGTLRDFVAAGRLGRKSGRGFYDYGATR